MNHHDFSWRTWTIVTALLLVPFSASAQSPYEGIYLGSYDGAGNAGEFALIVDNHGYATLATYDAVDDIGYLETDIAIHPDGSFEFVTRSGAHVAGLATAAGVSGIWNAVGAKGDFIGQRMPADGPFEQASGLYAGHISVTRPGSTFTDYGRMAAIVAADGSAFFLVHQSFPGAAGFLPGGFDFDFDLDLDLDLGWGFDIGGDFRIGPVAGFGAGYRTCHPFAFGGGYSFGISVGFLDLTFDFWRPSCSAFRGWGQFGRMWDPDLDAFQYSGGIVQVGSDRLIDAALLDGLQIEGYLDAQAGTAEGFLSGGAALHGWIGHWAIERQFDTDNVIAMNRYARLPDVDGDGDADILWRHAASGQTAVWLMDGTELVTELPLQRPAEIRGDPLWSLAAIEQLNDDSHADFVWRNAADGAVLVAYANGAGSTRFELDPVYRIVGSGDFNSDGNADILLSHRTTDANALITSRAGIPDLMMLPEIDEPNWTSVSVADFDGDTAPDILMTNRQTHELLVLLMNGLTPAAEIRLPATESGSQELMGIGDFDGDGSIDVLRRDRPAGALTVTRGLGKHGGEVTPLDAELPQGWHLAAIGDVDADGRDDLLWRQTTTGINASWHVVNGKVDSLSTLTPVRDPNWSIQQ